MGSKCVLCGNWLYTPFSIAHQLHFLRSRLPLHLVGGRREYIQIRLTHTGIARNGAYVCAQIVKPTDNLRRKIISLDWKLHADSKTGVEIENQT